MQARKELVVRSIGMAAIVWGAVMLLGGCVGAVDPVIDSPGVGNDIDPGAGSGGGGVVASGRGGAGGPSQSGGAGGTGGAPVGAVVADRAGVMPVERLTREELDNTLRDLLGDTSGVVSTMDEDSRGDSGFVQAAPVTGAYLDDLIDVIAQLGGGLSKRMTTLVGCNPTTVGEDACANQFLAKFGRRAYRRKLDAAEITYLGGAVKKVKADLGYSFYEALRVVVQGMLMSPSFLYHWEVGSQAPGPEGGLIRLTADQVASRLSYFLWASMPDDDLFAAADEGRLAGPADIEREARRLLASPKARAHVAAFHEQWLNLDRMFRSDGSLKVEKNPKVYPGFDQDLAIAMRRETSEFVTRTIIDGDGTLDSLLTSPSSLINDRLAKEVYKVAGITSKTMVPVSLAASERSGILSRASFLTVNARIDMSNPTKRGVLVYTSVLCGTLPEPPKDVPPLPNVPPPGLTTREFFEAHSQNECARACHGIFDPVGYAFEHYDGMGRYRMVDAGKAVDSTGTLRSPSDGESQPFKDAVELGHLLAGSADVGRCLTRQWFRFALKRRELAEEEQASLDAAFGEFGKSRYNIRELMVALAKTRSFSYRKPATGEVLQ